MTIFLTSHLAHQSRERMPLFLVNANYGSSLCEALLQNLADVPADFVMVNVLSLVIQE